MKCADQDDHDQHSFNSDCSAIPEWFSLDGHNFPHPSMAAPFACASTLAKPVDAATIKATLTKSGARLLLFNGATQECLRRFQQVAHQKYRSLPPSLVSRSLEFLIAASSVSLTVSDAPALVIAYRDAFHRWSARSCWQGSLPSI